MNLMHLFVKRDPNLILSDGIRKVKDVVCDRTLAGLRMPPGSSLRLKTAARWYPLNTRPATTGWQAKAAARSDRFRLRRRPAPTLLIAWRRQDGSSVVEGTKEVTRSPSLIDLPRLSSGMPLADVETLDLCIENPKTGWADITILISEELPLADLYEQAVGTGVEIGPGPHPRILPSDKTSVAYVERETIDSWRSKYSHSDLGSALAASSNLWPLYKVGTADNLPFPDRSLDFIFSAHVFEHLVNPLGHLEYWRSKLTAGGKILAIIPQLHGSSDYRNRPTLFSSLIEQFERGGFVETVDHHRAFGEARGLDPRKSFESRISVHFTFFNQDLVSQMLEWSRARLGFSSHSLMGGLNSKILCFTLTR